jgi:hypothetical protein
MTDINLMRIGLDGKNEMQIEFWYGSLFKGGDYNFVILIVLWVSYY